MFLDPASGDVADGARENSEKPRCLPLIGRPLDNQILVSVPKSDAMTVRREYDGRCLGNFLRVRLESKSRQELYPVRVRCVAGDRALTAARLNLTSEPNLA